MVAVCTTVRTVPAAPQRELCEKSLFEEPGQLGERLRRPDHRFRSEAGRGCLCCLEAMPLAALDQVPAGDRQCHLVLTARFGRLLGDDPAFLLRDGELA